ncbi:transcriptional regulator, AraC family [Bifidobacterium actinocoloniiforme DSM 22766]|uniref:Transcriptional regulator, AraC family n=1 Tax=Bifidobacterium actinocoloniiforme DSM 22766 TaxID=1437605 RepID=A0A086YYD2_9BIFI|nr:AraC family transcriptional regulator [Bifidobacterium actinocoloniiforme]KFI39282.1 transcriptional regulator, AraC family [Bifidobacterium actinocoloniiforme DSM 22766]
MENSIWYLRQPSTDVDGLSFAVCGISETHPDHSFGPALRSTYIVHIVLGGTGTVRREGTKYNLRRNDGFIVGPETPVQYQASTTTPWLYLWIGFSGSAVSSCLSSIGLGPSHSIFHVDQNQAFLRVITECFSYTGGSVSDGLKLNSLAYEFLHLLTEHATGSTLSRSRATSDETARKAIDYIAEHHAEGIGPGDVAKALHLDRSYLSRRFHEVTDLTLRDYIDGIRLDKACDLLGMTSLPVQEVAKECGYSSTEQFARKFKEKTSSTPAEYRQVRIDAHDDLNLNMDLFRTLFGR